MSRNMTNYLKLIIRSGDKRRLKRAVAIGVLILILRKSKRINRSMSSMKLSGRLVI